MTATTAELNILDGVTATAAELNILDGVTSTAAELNLLDGVTSTTAELNILDGVTATTVELNYVDGVTSNVQTQLDAKTNDGDNVNVLVGTTSAQTVPVDGNGDDNYLFLVVNKSPTVLSPQLTKPSLKLKADKFFQHITSLLRGLFLCNKIDIYKV